MVGVAIIGAGFMGATHGRAYGKVRDARVIAVVAQQMTRAEALAAELGARALADPDAIFRDPEVHLVDIAVPTPLHPEFAIRALQAGKHVVVEKPLALTVAEADSIITTAQRTGRFLFVAHVVRFWPEYITTGQVLASGRLGRPLFAFAQRLSNIPQWASWLSDPKATGGTVLDLQIHDLDILNSFFGRPQRVMASGVRNEAGGWSHVLTLLEYPGVSACAEASHMMPQGFPFTTALRVLCERGVIEYEFRAGGPSFEIGQPTTHLCLYEPDKQAQPVTVERADPYESEIAYFVGCVASGQPPRIVTPQDARLAIQVALAARDSLESASPVCLGSD